MKLGLTQEEMLRETRGFATQILSIAKETKGEVDLEDVEEAFNARGVLAIVVKLIDANNARLARQLEALGIGRSHTT